MLTLQLCRLAALLNTLVLEWLLSGDTVYTELSSFRFLLLMNGWMSGFYLFGGSFSENSRKGCDEVKICVETFAPAARPSISGRVVASSPRGRDQVR